MKYFVRMYLRRRTLANLPEELRDVGTSHLEFALPAIRAFIRTRTTKVLPAVGSTSSKVIRNPGNESIDSIFAEIARAPTASQIARSSASDPQLTLRHVDALPALNEPNSIGVLM